MGLVEGFVKQITLQVKLQRDPLTLYVGIDELPNPRDWGAGLCYGHPDFFSEDVNLMPQNSDNVEALIGQYWQEI